MTWEPFLLYLNKEYNLLVFSKLKQVFEAEQVYGI